MDTIDRSIPSATLEGVLRLYRERYFDLNVKHFHEKLTRGHALAVSYTWTRGALRGEGHCAFRLRRGMLRALLSSCRHLRGDNTGHDRCPSYAAPL